MREQEMRLRVFRYLKARMRNMIMPATVGLGLAVGGCSEPRSLYMGPLPSDAALVHPDGSSGDVAAIFGSEVASPDTRDVGIEGVPIYGSDVSLLDLRDAQMSEKAALDADKIDVGSQDVIPSSDNSQEAPPIVAKYVAPMPDAAGADLPVMRYMAQMPDTGIGG